MNETYESNRFLMKMQIPRIFETDSKKIVKSQFRLFSIEENNFVITITTIKNEGVWFDTSWYDVNRFKSSIEKHRIYSKDVDTFVSDILHRLTKSEIEQAEDICLRPISKYKTPKEIETPAFMEDQSKPRIKRHTPSPKIEVIGTTLITPITDAEKRQAKMERKLFHDPKMWKFKDE